MRTEASGILKQGGAIGKKLLLVIAVVVVAGLWLLTDEEAGKGRKKQAELKTIEIIGDRYRAKVGEEEIEATHPRFADAKGIK